jgi:peptide/nickel transport system permease protein
MTQPVVSEELPTAGTEEAAVRARSSLQLALARLRRDKVAVVSLVVVVLIVLTAVFAPVVAAITGHDPNFQYRDEGLTADGLPVAPNGEFWLGTDRLGRDVLVRLAYGARVSLVVGLLASACAVAIGVLVGTVSGYLRGRTDLVLNWVIDLILSIPFLLFAISLVSLVGPSLKISVLVIACFTWGPIARVVRGQVLSIREREFIEAARSLGGTRRRIIVRDVLPNLVAPIIVYATLLIPSAIVFEATLSFLGLSVTPPTATWGNMLAEASQNALYTVAWWIVVFPSLALLATTLAFNLLGDGLRDALDPGASRRPGRLARRVRGRRRAERAERAEQNGEAG